MSHSPRVVVLAGPNGAGKSTASQLVIRDELGIRDFVNADTIARGLSAFDVESVALESGRIMLDRLKKLAAVRKDFAFETTLASRTFAPWIRELKQESDYRFILVFLWLDSPESAIARVAQRVSHGGHDIPEEAIRRRYAAGLRNLFQLYKPLADEWRVYDNSNSGSSSLVTICTVESGETVELPEVWERVKGTDNMDSVRETDVPYGKKKQDDPILRAINRAGREVLITHKKMGWPLVTSRNGKVVTIPPEEIEIPPEA